MPGARSRRAGGTPGANRCGVETNNVPPHLLQCSKSALYAYARSSLHLRPANGGERPYQIAVSAPTLALTQQAAPSIRERPQLAMRSANSRHNQTRAAEVSRDFRKTTGPILRNLNGIQKHRTTDPLARARLREEYKTRLLLTRSASSLPSCLFPPTTTPKDSSASFVKNTAFMTANQLLPQLFVVCAASSSALLNGKPLPIPRIRCPVHPPHTLPQAFRRLVQQKNPFFTGVYTKRRRQQISR